MTYATIAANMAPFVRIGLYVITGWLGSSVLDPETVSLIREEPAILAGITGAFAAGWYALAKWRGWAK